MAKPAFAILPDPILAADGALVHPLVFSHRPSSVTLAPFPGLGALAGDAAVAGDADTGYEIRLEPSATSLQRGFTGFVIVAATADPGLDPARRGARQPCLVRLGGAVEPAAPRSVR
jgi:hypothetical protein